MVGADETTELWRPPQGCKIFIGPLPLINYLWGYFLPSKVRAKFRHFCKMSFAKFLTVYFLFGKRLSLLWQIWYILGLIFIVANRQPIIAKYFKNLVTLQALDVWYLDHDRKTIKSFIEYDVKPKIKQHFRRAVLTIVTRFGEILATLWQKFKGINQYLANFEPTLQIIMLSAKFSLFLNNQILVKQNIIFAALFSPMR